MIRQRRFRYIPRFAIILLTILFSTWLTACEQTQVATPEPVTITIAGSTGMRPVLQALTTEFSRRHPSVIFDLRGGGSTIGEQLVNSGEVNFGASLLPPPENGDLQTDLGDEKLFRLPIAIDGLAIVVNKENQIDMLSIAQLQDIYAGRIVNWSGVGGEDADILLISREDGSGARQLFESRVMGVESVSLTAVVMPTSVDVVDFVARNSTAIGYVSRAYVGTEFETTEKSDANAVQPISEAENAKVKVIALEGRFPTTSEIKDGSYPLSTPLFLVGKGEMDNWERQFVEFVLSPAGQQIVEKFHARVR